MALGSVTPAAAATPDEDARLRRRVQTVVESTTQEWSAVFQARGVAYASPRVLMLRSPIGHPALTPADLLTTAQAPATQHDRQVGRSAFLAPKIQQALLEGRHHPGLSLRSLLKTPTPLAWADHADWVASLDRD